MMAAAVEEGGGGLGVEPTIYTPGLPPSRRQSRKVGGVLNRPLSGGVLRCRTRFKGWESRSGTGNEPNRAPREENCERPLPRDTPYARPPPYPLSLLRRRLRLAAVGLQV